MASTPDLEHLARLVGDAGAPAEFPALSAQLAAWQIERPLAGARVVDATPVWRNTLPKHLALLLAGADLTVAALPAVPFDPRAVALLTDLGVPVVTTDVDVDVDVVCDCAGSLAGVRPRCGTAELTRSGAEAYRTSPWPVVLVDAGRLKLVETTLGTGDGFVRAMRHLGHGDFPGRLAVVFGAGKVGRGIARATRAAGATVALVDRQPPGPLPRGASLTDFADTGAVADLIDRAWCIVTATGATGALAPYAAALMRSDALVANMGVADEFGPDVPPGRVLNRKAPLNFVLPEPTRLRYLDPVFALSNVAALHLLRGDVPPGLGPPPPAWEEPILRVVRGHGVIASELAAL